MKLKRIMAYIFDIVFVTFLASLISQIEIINPYYDKYLEEYDSYIEMFDDMDLDAASKIVFKDDYINKVQNLAKYNSVVTIITFCCYILYFVGFQKWNNGQTLGKKIFGIKVLNKERKDASIWQYILRTCILYNIPLGFVSLLLAFIMPGKFYLIFSMILNLLSYIITILCFTMFAFRKDGRSFHDLLSGTIVE